MQVLERWDGEPFTKLVDLTQLAGSWKEMRQFLPSAQSSSHSLCLSLCVFLSLSLSHTHTETNWISVLFAMGSRQREKAEVGQMKETLAGAAEGVVGCSTWNDEEKAEKESSKAFYLCSSLPRSVHLWQVCRIHQSCPKAMLLASLDFKLTLGQPSLTSYSPLSSCGSLLLKSVWKKFERKLLLQSKAKGHGAECELLLWESE